jgi:hypothetical protein
MGFFLSVRVCELRRFTPEWVNINRVSADQSDDMNRVSSDQSDDMNRVSTDQWDNMNRVSADQCDDMNCISAYQCDDMNRIIPFSIYTLLLAMFIVSNATFKKGVF